jgi:hypothetical protein
MDEIDRALERGARRKDELVQEAGGLLGAEEVTALLGISPELHQRRLLVVEVAGGLGYPAFQFESEIMGAGVDAILGAIAVEAPWARFNFMFLNLSELDGARPVDAIRSGKLASAVLAAGHYGNHGAS